jgi:hypothetical protein
LVRGRSGTGLPVIGAGQSQNRQERPETEGPHFRAAWQMHWLFRLSMIFSENRFTLFGIMLVQGLPGELER